MRLINADEIQYAKDWVVTDKIPKVGGYNANAIYRVTKEEIDAMPTVDAVPVRRGYWIRHDYADIVDGYYVPNYECSVCHAWKQDDSDYCPDCGALNDGKDGDG